MIEVKTELASVEEHDNAVRKAVERRAYTLYELDGLKEGHDQHHWFRAEREIVNQDVTFSLENDAVTVRLAMEDFPASTLVVSISARSVLIFSLNDESTNRECVRIISLPVAVDPARVTHEPDEKDLALRLPLAASALPFSKSASV
jgi:hypothetical protein